MGSRREEERNEMIIRGLKKLPPNRRCINCNSLGPQYVCTNFWTFVCMTCSGIHREFTHRVKSVSMSKFTSQEVDSLQSGGNQHAREIYLKGWDHQGQRLPDNSNVHKVREFIKNVYIDKKYAAVITHNKPPRDMQNFRSLENETRRASSYHSYSQSPPYDFQYEDRRYGKQGSMLTRKPGSDRGIYVKKTSSFTGSPTHFTDEGSVSRFSDYSVSSGGEPVRSGRESPSFQKDNGFSSPPVQSSRDSSVENPALNLFSEANFKKDTGSVHGPQRTMSLGSIGNVSIKSSDSGSIAGVTSGPEDNTVSYQDKMVSLPNSSSSMTNGTLDLFEAPFVPAPQASSASSIDLFQLPGAPTAPSVDSFHASPLDSASSTNLCPPSDVPLPSSMDLFAAGVGQQAASTLGKKASELSVPMSGGWANFDSPQSFVTSERHEDHTHAVTPPGVGSSGNFDKASSQSANLQCPPLQTSSAQGSLLVSDPWKEGFHNVLSPINQVNAQVWKAFDDNSIMPLPAEGMKPNSESQSVAGPLSQSGTGPLSQSATGPLSQSATGTLSTLDQHMGLRVGEDSNDYAFQRAALYEGYAVPTRNSDFALGPTFMFPVMEDSLPNAISNRTTNPFDLPYDSDLEPAHMFLDMSSLQAALPNSQLPPAFFGGVSQQWCPPDTATNYIPAAPQGGLVYMAGEAPTSQYPNLQTQGHVASIGGNPFA